MIPIIAAVALTIASVGLASEPTAEELSLIVEPAIKARLVDPESARFRWPYSFFQARNGTITCGRVNSRNRMGGYGGEVFFVLVFNRGQAPYFNMAEYEGDALSGDCQRYIRRGLIIPR